MLLGPLLVLGRGHKLVGPLGAYLGEAAQRILRDRSVGCGRHPRRVRRAVGIDMHAGHLEGRERLRELRVVVLKNNKSGIIYTVSISMYYKPRTIRTCGQRHSSLWRTSL
jgi:hypothetical protein